ncbi:SUMF1/EgtB/PvdO family nonheme iron enzyme [Winogradskyella sp.]|uniref:SUMF1/EgtB/PvdO family nonheme iron enzyme n=1 Tax=Winogradskyella sp. TaxID=1883156 RepID=UPI003BAA364C
MRWFCYISLLLILASCSKEQKLETVTVAQFSAFVDATGYVTDAEKFGWSIVQQTVYDFKTQPGATWQKPDGITLAQPQFPVTQVSYNDAKAYAKWANVQLPNYQKFWEHAWQDKRKINTNNKAIKPVANSNLIGNVWDITEPIKGEQIRLAGGSYLCDESTCNGRDPYRELYVDKMTGNTHIGFSVLK